MTTFRDKVSSDHVFGEANYGQPRKCQVQHWTKNCSGKRKSGMNAVKHGLSAETIVIGNEDPNEFRALGERLEQDFQPETTLEFELVERLAA